MLFFPAPTCLRILIPRIVCLYFISEQSELELVRSKATQKTVLHWPLGLHAKNLKRGLGKDAYMLVFISALLSPCVLKNCLCIFSKSPQYFNNIALCFLRGRLQSTKRMFSDIHLFLFQCLSWHNCPAHITHLHYCSFYYYYCTAHLYRRQRVKHLLISQETDYQLV